MKTVLVKLNGQQDIKVTEDTQFVLNTFEYDPQIHHDINFIFETQGVSAEVIGLYFLKPKQELSITTAAVHKVPNTSCMTDVRGALQDSAKSNYVGKIIIEKSAQQTSSFLDDKALILGDNVKNESQPILEIEADDVKASHGATTGRIPEENVYYLQSRGLDKEEAKVLIVEGFFEELLSKIEDKEIAEEVRTNLFK